MKRILLLALACALAFVAATLVAAVAAAATLLGHRVRRTVAFHHNQVLNTRENTATEIMLSCLAFGCNAQVDRADAKTKSQRLNGITCLCWNYPCAGYEPLAISEGRIAAKELGNVAMAIPLDHWQQRPPPELRAVVIAAPRHRPFQVAILVEQEQWMLAGTVAVPIVRRALLVAIGLAHRAIHIEDQFLQRLSLMRLPRRAADRPVGTVTYSPWT